MRVGSLAIKAQLLVYLTSVGLHMFTTDTACRGYSLGFLTGFFSPDS